MREWRFKLQMEGAMDLQDGIETSESRFAAYVEALASALGAP
ncbi:transposase (plasmid) [Sinorhizobium sp. CCBAU 05631]|nr:transposase [Sinorhizobium sp. CCBAU 05631]ASY74147.1 transposase [Sinorhizobium fredii CCBAU 83666]